MILCSNFQTLTFLMGTDCRMLEAINIRTDSSHFRTKVGFASQLVLSLRWCLAIPGNHEPKSLHFNTRLNAQKPAPRRKKYQHSILVWLFSCSFMKKIKTSLLYMPLTSILKNRRIFCVRFDISRTAAQIPTKLWEVNPKTLSFDLITKETISVEWLLTSNRIKLFFNVFFWYILFLSMDFFRSTCNQTRIFSFNFCADFHRSSGCHFEAILEDRIWHKISKKMEYNVTD